MNRWRLAKLRLDQQRERSGAKQAATVHCPHCGLRFAPAGFRTHLASCARSSGKGGAK